MATGETDETAPADRGTHRQQHRRLPRTLRRPRPDRTRPQGRLRGMGTRGTPLAVRRRPCSPSTPRRSLRLPALQREHRKQRLVLPPPSRPTPRSAALSPEPTTSSASCATAPTPLSRPLTDIGRPTPPPPATRTTTSDPSPPTSAIGPPCPLSTTKKRPTPSPPTAPPTSATWPHTGRPSTPSSPATSPPPTAFPEYRPSKSGTSPVSPRCAPPTWPPWPARTFARSVDRCCVWSGPSRMSPTS